MPPSRGGGRGGTAAAARERALLLGGECNHIRGAPMLPDFVVPAEHRARNFILRPLRARTSKSTLRRCESPARACAPSSPRRLGVARRHHPRRGPRGLRRHEAEWERRLAFAYTVLSATNRAASAALPEPSDQARPRLRVPAWTTDATQDGALEAVVRGGSPPRGLPRRRLPGGRQRRGRSGRSCRGATRPCRASAPTRRRY